MAKRGIAVTVVWGRETRCTRIEPGGSPNGDRATFSAPIVTDEDFLGNATYRWSDEGVTWVRGHVGAAEAAALLTAYALRQRPLDDGTFLGTDRSRP